MSTTEVRRESLAIPPAGTQAARNTSPVLIKGGYRLTILQIMAHIAALLPLAVLIWNGLHNQLTVNPIQEIENRTGRIALVEIVVSLACTPVNIVFGFKQVLKLRRPLGLYSFLYAGLHFLTFSVLDYGLDTGLIWDQITQKRYLLVGLVSLLLLVPLALTSTRGWMKRLGKFWTRVHWLVYVAAPLAVLHFVWEVKADMREPFEYGAILAILLVLRLPPIRRFCVNLRYRFIAWLRSRQPIHATAQ